jgi:hypothetical protein
MTAFSQLDDTELATPIEALQRQRLMPTASRFSLRRYRPAPKLDSIATELDRLTQAGWQTAAVLFPNTFLR